MYERGASGNDKQQHQQWQREQVWLVTAIQPKPDSCSIPPPTHLQGIWTMIQDCGRLPSTFQDSSRLYGIIRDCNRPQA